ncbi:MAG: Crp/Fnr family transcriptional regulator [Proteobacteria bacterium]|nr:Crp/Fnr family transcriptional regulator [Pseudomonadota bacterium]
MTNAQSQQQYTCEYPAGTVLFRQGERGEQMYVVRSGKLELTRNVGGREARLGVLEAGEFCGELSVLAKAPRSATARVIERARLLVIEASTFETMIEHSTEVAVRLIQQLATRLVDSSRQVELLLLRHPHARVAKYLRQEAEVRGQPDPEGLAVELTSAGMATHLGLTRDEVNAGLQRLERARLLRQRADGVLVVADGQRTQDFIDFLEMKQLQGGSPTGAATALPSS